MSSQNQGVGPFRIKHYWHATRIDGESYRTWLRRAAAGKVANPERKEGSVQIADVAKKAIATKHMKAVGK